MGMARGVACGMVYLSDMNFIHRVCIYMANIVYYHFFDQLSFHVASVS